MKLVRYSPNLVLLCALLTLCACQYLGLEPVPKSFDGRLSAAYTTNTALRDGATNSLATGAISSEDGAKALSATRDFRLRLDQLKALASTDLSTAEARLALLESSLAALRAELLAKGVKVDP
jgi:hypothetical protein